MVKRGWWRRREESTEMRGGGKLFMVAGVGLALVAVLLLGMAFFGGNETTPSEVAVAEAPPITVVKAMRDVPAHTILTTQDVYEESVAPEGVPANSVKTTADVVGQAYGESLVTGQRLSFDGVEQPGLSNDIAAGKRAMSLPVDTGNLLSGLVQDDDHVDLIFKARINEVRLLGHVMGPSPEDQPTYEFSDDEGFGWIPIDMVDEYPAYPAAGDPGSQMHLRDGVGEEQQLEPVAKVMLQDVRVLRVVRPGEKFGSNGQPVVAAVVEGAPAASDGDLPGFLVVEVNNQQAELLAFMIDAKHVYNVAVRGKDDHQKVATTGVTFEILATNDAYGLPLPGSVTIDTGLPSPGNALVPEELPEGDYRSGQPLTLPSDQPAAEEPR